MSDRGSSWICMGPRLTKEEIEQEIESLKRVCREIRRSPEESLKFLQEAGILDENGDLAKENRDEDA